MRRVLIAASALLAVPQLAFGQGSVQEIAVGDNFFQPEDVSLDVGVESVHWGWTGTGSSHNVFQEAEIFSSGDPATSGDLTITPSAGVFKYYCQPHGFISDSGEPSGMAGEIAVKPTATPQGKRTLVTWATEATDTGSQFDVRRKIGSKKAKVVESKTKAIEKAFKIEKGKKYKFDVRSRQGKATSDWSPKLTVKG